MGLYGRPSTQWMETPFEQNFVYVIQYLPGDTVFKRDVWYTWQTLYGALSGVGVEDQCQEYLARCKLRDTRRYSGI